MDLLAELIAHPNKLQQVDYRTERQKVYDNAWWNGFFTVTLSQLAILTVYLSFKVIPHISIVWK